MVFITVCLLGFTLLCWGALKVFALIAALFAGSFKVLSAVVFLCLIWVVVSKVI